MADAFRGLTIRLGADARPLNSALSSITSSARKAQTQLSAMNKALKFDSHNTAAMSARIDLMGDKALLAARAVTKIETAMSQVSNETKEVAAGTSHVYAAVEKVRSGYNHTNASLQRIYDSVRRIYAAENNLDATSEKVDEHIKSIQRNYGGASAKAKELTKEMDELLAKAAGTKTMKDRFGLKGEADDAKRLTSYFKNLRAEHSKFIEKSNELKAVEGFKAMETQLIAWNAELKQACMELARFKSELYSVQSGAGVDKLLTRIDRIDNEIDQATASARRMDEAFRKMPGSVQAATMKLNAEKSAMESLEDKAEALRAIIKSIESTPGFDKLEASTRNVHKWVSEAEHDFAEFSAKAKVAEERLGHLENEMKEFQMVNFIGPQRSLDKVEKELEDVNKEFTEATAKAEHFDDELKKANRAKMYRGTIESLNMLQAELTQSTTKANALRRALDFSKTIRTMGYGLYSTITPAIMMAGRYAIQSARDIDSAYRDMRKTVNGTEEQFQGLLDSALKFSTTHFTSAEQMLEIEAMGGQLGISADKLEAFGETVSNLDIATNIDADSAAEQLGKMATVLDITEDQYSLFGDALVRLGNNMPVLEGDITTLMTRFMGMGKVVGMQPDEMLAWAAAASATGQKAEAAGSSMQRFISNMETAVVSGGDDLEAWAKVARMSGEEFKQAFEEDASNAMFKFVEGLGEMQKNGDSVNQTLKELGINNVRDKQLLEGLAVQMANSKDGTTVLGEALKMARDAYHGMATEMKDGSIEYAGDAAREAGKKAEGFSGQLQEMINTAQLLATELAEGALPYIVALKDAFQSLATSFSALPDGMKTFIVGAVGALAMVGPLAVGFGAVGAAVDSLMEAFTAATATRTLAKAAAGVGPLEKGLAQIATVSPRAASGLETVALMAMEVAPAVLAMAPAIAAAAAAIAFLVTDISKAAANADNFNKSVDGYADAVSKSIPSLESSAGGFDNLATSVHHAQVNLDDLAKSQAETRQTIVERNRAAQDEIAELSAAKSIIDQYLGKSLDASQAAQFRAAVERVNEACGTQFQVVNAAAGAIRDEKGALLETSAAIDEYINKKRLEIQQQALSADYADAHSAEREAYKAMTSQLATYNDLREQARNADSQADKDYYDGLADEAYSYYEKLFAMHKEAEAGEEAIAKQMEATAEVAENGVKSVEAAVRANDKWMDSFKAIYGDDAWASGLEGFISALNEVGVKQDDIANMAPEDIAKVVDAYSRTGDIVAALQSVGVEVVSLQDKMRSGFEAAGQNFDYFVEQLGGDAESIAQAFNNAGGAASVFANVTSEQIAQALAESEGNVETFIAKLQDFASQNTEAEFTVTADTSEAEANVDGLYSDVEGGADGAVNIDDSSAEAADETVEDLGTDVNNLPENRDISVNVSGNASGVLSDIYWYLTNMPTSKEVTVTTHKVEDARGGFYALHAAGGRFKLHGSGSFITSGPTVLGSDRYGYVHIAGEAGREWIKRHADGTTSIVPIENRRYLKPYAREIAGMIGGAGTTNYYITLDYKAGDDANKIVRDLGFALRTSAMMEG